MCLFACALAAHLATHGNSATSVSCLLVWQNVGIWLAGQVCIADAIAASSCFPPLFRPIHIPVKYPGPNGAIDTVIPLTDGGVYDNLGA